MSLTVTAFIVTGFCAVLAITFFSLLDSGPGFVFLGGVSAALAVGALITAIASFNVNSGETKRQLEAECIEAEGKISYMGDRTLCISNDGDILRRF